MRCAGGGQEGSWGGARDARNGQVKENRDSPGGRGKRVARRPEEARVEGPKHAALKRRPDREVVNWLDIERERERERERAPLESKRETRRRAHALPQTGACAEVASGACAGRTHFARLGAGVHFEVLADATPQVALSFRSLVCGLSVALVFNGMQDS